MIRNAIASALAVAVVVLLPSAAAAAPWSATGFVVRGDFDKDGNLERVVSSPESDGDKGAIYIVDDAAGTTVRWTRDQSGLAGDAAAAGDFFGAALAVGDFDGDGKADLAIGVPGADDGGPSNSGAIHIVYGSTSGLTTTGDQVFHQDTSGIKGAAETDDYFGAVLTAGDFDCDGYDDVVIGVPMEGISTKSDAGAVQVFYGGSSGVTTADDLWYQGSGGVNGAAEAGDHFGAALAVGNFNGDTNSSLPCEDLAIGAPHEHIGSISDAGLAYSVLGGTSGLSTTGDIGLHQDVSGVNDQSEADDRFGLRLAVLDSDGDGYDDLAVAVPGDSCLTGHGEGTHLFLGTSTGIEVTDDVLECSTYRCSIDEETDFYGCQSSSPTIFASTSAETIAMFVGDDVVYGDGGDDAIKGNFGDDTLFGGDDNDTFTGGPGLDVQIGGAGDDVFIIDSDCFVQDGEVIDGGPGDDEIHSHLTRTELLAAGLTIESADVVSIAEGDGTCILAPHDEGTLLQPRVALSWEDLADPDSVFTLTSGTIGLAVDNGSDDAVTVDLEFRLTVRGWTVEHTPASISLTANSSTVYELDLEDFIPGGINPQTTPAHLLELPTSAVLRAKAEVTVSSESDGMTFAPIVYGHLEDGDEAVLYREQALEETY